MKSPALISVFLLGLVCLCGAAHADMVTITSDRDSGIYAASSDLANGAGPSFLVGKTGSNGITRALMRFDVAGTVPDGATVNSAALTLRMIQTRAPATDVSLHRVLKDWGEGTSSATGCCGSGVGAGDPSTPGDATWEHTFFDSDLWTTPGGDFAPTASATANVGLVGSYTWGSTAQLAADVQSWLDDPANNFGWIAIGGEAPVLDSLGKVFGSHQNGTAANRPALEIDFDLPVLTPGDANGDGVVDVADLGIVGANFNSTGATFSDGDFNDDGSVDVADLGIVGANWTAAQVGSDQTQVPEPASLALLGAGLIVIGRRR